MKPVHVIAAVMTALAVVSCSKPATDTTPPRVVSTSPANMSQDIDPSLTELSVTFNEAMTDGNWSWAYRDKADFPQLTGQPYYDAGKITNTVPVKLEPNKEYSIWINTEQFTNFKDLAGNAALPFEFTFKTRAE